MGISGQSCVTEAVLLPMLRSYGAVLDARYAVDDGPKRRPVTSCEPRLMGAWRSFLCRLLSV
jgi:hypothetical protein